MQTVTIHGSNGECLVQFGRPGEFIRGRRVDVTVTSPENDTSGEISLAVRQAMVGKTFSTVLTAEQVIEQCGSQFKGFFQPGTRLAYVHEVTQVLRDAGLNSEADQLEQIAPDSLDMYTFPKECYVLEEEALVV